MRLDQPRRARLKVTGLAWPPSQVATQMQYHEVDAETVGSFGT